MDGDLTLADVLEVAQLGAQVAAWAGSEMRTAFFGRGFVAGVANAGAASEIVGGFEARGMSMTGAHARSRSAGMR